MMAQQNLNINGISSNQSHQQQPLNLPSNAAQEEDFYEPMAPSVPLTDRQKNGSPDKTNNGIIQNQSQV
jgi:hypothetical protein